MDSLMEKPGILYPDEVHKIIGCAMSVYNTLGRGFLEAVYHDALEVELVSLGIPFARISRSRARRRKNNAIGVNLRRRASQRLACRLKWALPTWANSRFFYL